MKKSLKALVAILAAASLILCFASCGAKDEEEPVTEQLTSAAEIVTDEAATEEVTEEAASAEATEEASAPEETTAEEASEEKTEEAKAAISEAPETTEEILALYNKTVNDAYDKKVGFYKERVCDNENLNAGVAFQAFKSLVYKFMGIGADNKYTETQAKGQWDGDANRHYLRKSTLTAADLTGATCTKNGDSYVITLSVKPGSTQGSASSRTGSTPIDKCGICVGNEDKGYYDHKTGPVIYDAIEDVFGKAVVDESYSNAKVTATVNGESGQLEKLVVEYDISTTIDTNSITGAATASGRSHVTYSDFKY